MSCKYCFCNPSDKETCRIENRDGPQELEALLLDLHKPQQGCTRLCLSSCNLTSIQLTSGSNCAAHLASLTSLDLSNNSISTIPDDFFSYVPNLKYLNFSNNRISNIPPTIEILEKVEEVSFKNNLLRENSIPLASVMKLTYIKSFNVYDNFIDTNTLIDSAPSTVPANLMSMVNFFCSFLLVGSWNQNTPSRITDNLYLGSAEITEHPDELRHLGITHILSVGVRPSNCDGFTKKFIMALDFPSVALINHFDEAVEFIDSAVQAGKGCFVHCAMGVSRSATCVCAWLIKRRGMSANEALDYVKKARKCVSPNLGFIEQLLVYDKRIHGN